MKQYILLCIDSRPIDFYLYKLEIELTVAAVNDKLADQGRIIPQRYVSGREKEKILELLESF